MKKTLIVTLIMFSLLGTTSSFAQPQTENQTIKLTQELMRINDDLSLAFSSILSGNYNAERLKKDMEFARTRLSAIIHGIQTTSNYSDSILKKRELETIQYLASGDMLSANGILVFLEDPANNYNFLLDAITAYTEGLRVLEELQEAIYQIYKVQLKPNRSAKVINPNTKSNEKRSSK